MLEDARNPLLVDLVSDWSFDTSPFDSPLCPIRERRNVSGSMKFVAVLCSSCVSEQI